MRHYLEALAALQTDDNARVAAWLHEHEIDDALMQHTAVRLDGRVMNDLYVVQVKLTGNVQDPLEMLERVGVLKAADAYPIQGSCPLLKRAIH